MIDIVEFFRAALSSRYDEAESWNRRSQNRRPVSLSTGKIVRDPYWDERCDAAQRDCDEAVAMMAAFEADPVAFLRDVATKAELATKAP